MKIKYDPKIDVLYIEFKPGKVTTKRLDRDVAVDYDKTGSIAGLEVLSASERLEIDPQKPKVRLEQLAAL